MRPVALLLSLIVCSAVAQQPQVDERPTLIICVPDRPTTQSQQLLTWFASDPDLAAMAARCHRHDYTPDNKLYQERYAGVLKASDFPTVALADVHGRVMYKASAHNLPTTAKSLYAEMKHFASIAYKAPSGPWPERNLRSFADEVNGSMLSSYDNEYPSDCPDGNCPLQPPPLQPTYEPAVPAIPDSADVAPYGGSMGVGIAAAVLLVALGLFVIVAVTIAVLYFVFRR